MSCYTTDGRKIWEIWGWSMLKFNCRSFWNGLDFLSIALLCPVAFSPKIIRSNDEFPTKCIDLVSGHSAAPEWPDHKSSLLKISRLNPATQRSAGCSIIWTFNYLQIENGKNRKRGGFAINSFLFCPENVYSSWPRYSGGGKKQNQNWK